MKLAYMINPFGPSAGRVFISLCLRRAVVCWVIFRWDGTRKGMTNQIDTVITQESLPGVTVIVEIEFERIACCEGIVLDCVGRHLQ